MEHWSDLPVRDRFRVKFYLDTNILAYLCDKNYSGLTYTIDYLKTSEFADLVSSRFVIFEFVGIRKREYYLREVAKKMTSATTGAIDMNSLMKYKDDFDAPDLKFEDVQAGIKATVMKEVEEISTNFDIEYDKNILHDDLLAPTFDIILDSKLSRHDSLMLVSSIWPDATKKDDFVFLVSNDKAFVQHCTGSTLDAALASHNLAKPKVELLRSMQLNNQRVNLTLPTDDQHLPTYLPAKLKDLMVMKNLQYYLGKTIPPGNGAGFPADAIHFELNANALLNNNLYLTIIGRDLDFVYSTKLPVDNFWNRVAIQHYPFQSNQIEPISFRPTIDNGNGPVPIDAAIVTRLRETGNLIFINPDAVGL